MVGHGKPRAPIDRGGLRAKLKKGEDAAEPVKTHGPGMKIMNVLGLSLVPLALGQVSNPSAQECSVDNL